MIQVDVHEAKTHLSRLLERVANGEELIIARSGKPLARLVPLERKREPRVLGQFAGQVRMAEDFDVLPEDFQAMFDGEMP